MVVQEHEILSEHSCEHLWEELTKIENLGRWGAIDDVVSLSGDVLEPANSYVGTLASVPSEMNAAVVVIAFHPCERLSLRICTPLAIVHEHLDLWSADSGSCLHYSVDAASAMFGPRVTMWLNDHVAMVATKLERFAQELA